MGMLTPGLAPEVSFTNLFGMVMYGAPAFAKRHCEILSTFYRGTTKSHVIRRLRFVTSEVAIVDIDNEVRGVKSMPSGIVVPPDGVVKTQLMEVFVRREGRWWIAAYHNVDVKSAKVRGCGSSRPVYWAATVCGEVSKRVTCHDGL